MAWRNVKKPRTGDYHTEVVRYVKNSLRYVDPYEYTFSTFAKGRWVGSALVEVFQREFIAFSKVYYEKAILEGRITVNGNKVPVEYIIRNNDAITHRTICTENPVSAVPIEIIHESKELLVVNKPSSIPVHACGGYRQNTLIALLESERNNKSELLLPTHRIDRLTSGIVILGKTRDVTREISELLATESTPDNKRVAKEYLALAKGRVELPDTEQSHITVTGYITCTDMRVGKYICSQIESPESKYSETHVIPVKYFADEDETLVLCKPITGRTHQIRLHLQAIGHPIVNDICYGGVWDTAHPYAVKQIPSLQYDTAGNLHCGGIFLHAWRYTIPSMNLEFASRAPDWTRQTDIPINS